MLDFPPRRPRRGERPGGVETRGRQQRKNRKMNPAIVITTVVLAAAVLLLRPQRAKAGDGAAATPPDPIPLILDMVHHNPGGKRYESKFNNPETLEKMGYNGKVYFLFDSPMLAVDWAGVDPEICPEGSEYRKWVDAKAKLIDGEIAACKKAGLKIYAMSDLILFPKTLVDKYEMRKTFGDPRDPRTRKFLRLLIDQVFTRFPDYDGLVVRIGETYLHDAPYFCGKILSKKDPERTIIPLLRLLREEVCVKRGKTLIFRTWMSFDTNADAYMKVSNAVEPHENLYISVKHCEGDFHRTHPFSKVLGMGRHKQIVEVQCAREYEGKGAYPNYIARGVIEGFEEHLATMPDNVPRSIRDVWRTGKLQGVWTWSRGGGWCGPYIKSEMWCELNAWVVARWANHPGRSEEEIFHQYATERLGLDEKNAAKFRELALLSADAVIRGLASSKCYMRPGWTRDQGMNWPRLPKEHRREILREKDESVEMWRKIVALAKEIEWPDKTTRRAAVSSSLYGLHLYRIYRAVLELRDAADRKDADAVRKWLKEYDSAWKDYQALPKEYPDVLATLYEKDYKRYIKNPAAWEVEKLRAAYAEGK